ncbi:hypothetical protein C5167_050844 [Papaver somniferum]|uniref:Uncharacterized protein n=1 Tax=Papaver somniferum TaxID=3469 RepID=A0A4Y7KTT7_PAPSO|nr:hypothetical protein C5167_050844 [Papaver somniferum]
MDTSHLSARVSPYVSAHILSSLHRVSSRETQNLKGKITQIERDRSREGEELKMGNEDRNFWIHGVCDQGQSKNL